MTSMTWRKEKRRRRNRLGCFVLKTQPIISFSVSPLCLLSLSPFLPPSLSPTPVSLSACTLTRNSYWKIWQSGSRSKLKCKMSSERLRLWEYWIGQRGTVIEMGGTANEHTGVRFLTDRYENRHCTEGSNYAILSTEEISNRLIKAIYTKVDTSDMSTKHRK